MAETWLVTGAGGFLGHRVALGLARRGHRVVGTWRTQEIALPGVRMLRADLADRDATAELLQRESPDHLFHAAALTNVATCESDHAAAHRDIVLATRNLAQVWRGRAAIMVSTDLVFDGESAPYAEGASPKPLSAYGSQKIEAEEIFRALPQGSVLRSALVFGPSDIARGGFVAWMAGELRAGRPLTLFSDEYRTPVFSEDIADAAERIAASEETGIYHAGGPERLSRVDLGVALAQAMGADESLIRPALLADSTFPAPRARDVSLVSDRLRHRLRWTPRRFADFLAEHFQKNTEDPSP